MRHSVRFHQLAKARDNQISRHSNRYIFFSNLIVLNAEYQAIMFFIPIASNDLKQVNALTKAEREQAIQRCIQTLVHASRCKEQQCLRSCMKMKRISAHMKICSRKANGGCPICKQLIVLWCYHAKFCNEVDCSVSFCPLIKSRLRARVEQRKQQQQFSDEMDLLIHSMQNMMNGDLSDIDPLIQSMNNMMHEDDSS